MSKALKRIFSLFLIVLMFNTVYFTYAAEESLLEAYGEEPDPDTVYTEDELADWLANNQTGTVTLGGSITITNTIFVTSPVTIDTGAFGLVYNKALVNMQDVAAQIVGEGVDSPVVDVKETAYMWGGDWNNLLCFQNITATGRNGEGGAALRISALNQGAYDTMGIIFSEPGKIRSYGAGAIGVELAVPFDLYGFDIEAEGEGSVAIYAHAGGSAHFCRISADSAAVCSEISGFIVHNCSASPAIKKDGVLVTRAALSDYQIYYPVPKNSSLDDMIDDINRFYLTVPFKETIANSKISSIFVEWDQDALSRIDMGKTGVSIVSGELFGFASDWFSELLTVDWPVRLMIDVRDPLTPCIISAHFCERIDGEPVVQMALWTLPLELWEQCILWRSDDGGKTWYDCTSDTEVAWNIGSGDPPMSVDVASSVISEGTTFQVEIPGIGGSNIVIFTFVDGEIDCGQGGDRTGADRIIGVKPGLDIAVPTPYPGVDHNVAMSGKKSGKGNRAAAPYENAAVSTFDNYEQIPLMPTADTESTYAESTPAERSSAESPDVLNFIPAFVSVSYAAGAESLTGQGLSPALIDPDPDPQPALPKPETDRVILAISASVALLAAVGYALLGRRKLYIKR